MPETQAMPWWFIAAVVMLTLAATLVTGENYVPKACVFIGSIAIVEAVSRRITQWH